MRHAILDQHAVIAWDMDSTLIDGPSSEFFRAYIAAHPEKRHHVITFRNRTWADCVLTELAEAGLDPGLIGAVESCPEHLFDIHHQHLIRPAAATKTASGEFLRWKGKAARKLGCTVLVDDAEEWVVVGCQEHDIVFLHAHELLEPR